MRRRSRHAVSALAAILVTCTVSDAWAQQARLAISGGSATDQLGTRSTAMTLAPTVSLVTSDDIALSIGAHATRFGTSAWSFGGGASLSARRRVAGPVALTLDGAGSLARLTTSAGATFGSAEILPGTRVDFGRLGIFAAARLASGMVSVTSRGPALSPLAPRSGSERTTRSGTGSAVGANVLVVRRPDMTLSVGGRSDRLRVGEQAIADLTLSTQLRSRALGVDASVGRRAGAERATSGTIGVLVPLGGNVALELAGGRYFSNPMLGTPSGRYMSAGLSIGLGDATPPRRAPSVRIPGVPQPPRGYTRLAIVAPDAERVEVAGDFNEWMPTRATRAANGMWYADLRIAPGQYRYAFRIDGSEWRVPRGATAVNDGFGGTSAWLVVTVDESGD